MKESLEMLQRAPVQGRSLSDRLPSSLHQDWGHTRFQVQKPSKILSCDGLDHERSKKKSQWSLSKPVFGACTSGAVPMSACESVSTPRPAHHRMGQNTHCVGFPDLCLAIFILWKGC